MWYNNNQTYSHGLFGAARRAGTVRVFSKGLLPHQHAIDAIVLLARAGPGGGLAPRAMFSAPRAVSSVVHLQLADPPLGWVRQFGRRRVQHRELDGAAPSELYFLLRHVPQVGRRPANTQDALLARRPGLVLGDVPA